MNETVTPSERQSKAAFQNGFTTWSRHLHSASTAPKQAVQSILAMIHHAFPNHPTLPTSLMLEKHDLAWQATGMSTWGNSLASNSSSTRDDHAHCPGLPHHPPKKLNVVVTKRKPTKITLSKDAPSIAAAWPNPKYKDDHHLAVLFLAWAYILSARWTELIPGADPIRYTETTQRLVREDQNPAFIPIETASGEARRWWNAVLTAGQGWLATATSSAVLSLSSPWSTRLSSSHMIVPIYNGHDAVSATGVAADSATALGYLTEYCKVRHLEDQSCAALSTVLFLPMAPDNHIIIPAPRVARPGPSSSPPDAHQRAKWHSCPSMTQVDRLMALSCNTHGLRALLLSTFFDPNISCNEVSPFLQGTFAVLDGIESNQILLLQTLMHRAPKLGFLWVGAMISGLHTSILQNARYGRFDVDPVMAAWTGTINTMQLPVSPAVSGRIRRDDECRLAHLACPDFKTHVPFTPWKPFGTTAVKDTEIEVQIHAHCNHHGLRYQGWSWDCWKDGKRVRIPYQLPKTEPVLAGSIPESSYSGVAPPTIEAPYDELFLQDDGVSSTATLNIFVWLRRGGFAASEQHIRRHEWLCETLDEEEEKAYESWPEDEDDLRRNRKRAKSTAPKPKLGNWLAATQAERGHSV